MNSKHGFPRANLSDWRYCVERSHGGPTPTFWMGYPMDITTLQVVEGRAAKVVEADTEELEVAEPVGDEADESETPELSIEELEEIFSDLT